LAFRYSGVGSKADNGAFAYLSAAALSSLGYILLTQANRNLIEAYWTSYVFESAA
jgi:hypothetical protein